MIPAVPVARKNQNMPESNVRWPSVGTVSDLLFMLMSTGG